MDIVTYAVVNGISVEDAKAVLEEMAKDDTEKKSVVPQFDLYHSYDRRHYADRGAARSVPLAYTQ